MDVSRSEELIRGLSISLTGIIVVFAGLILVAVYIVLLPKFLELISQSKVAFELKVQRIRSIRAEKRKTMRTTKELISDSEAEDIASIIAMVLHLEQQRIAPVDDEQITIDRTRSQPSLWGMSGKMRILPVRRSNA